MQQFSHDYTKVSEALENLYSATRLIANECYDAALQRINNARTTLSEYLAQDNMVPDNDLFDGWVRHSEAQAELEALRSMVGDTHRSAPDGLPDGTAASPAPKVERHGQIDRQYKQQLDGVGNPDCPLYGKIVRITGTFDQLDMTRDQVAAACQQLGAAEASDGICKKMDIVIIGNNPGPSKLKKIAKWRSEGCSIQTLDQLQLKEIIDKFINN